MLFVRQREEQPSEKKSKRSKSRKAKNSGLKEGQEYQFCLVKV